MRAVLAIMGVALRNAVRSRVVLVLLCALVLGIIGLPLTVKGDGTLEGQVQVLLTYTLGATAVILSIATVWAGCAAVSTEVQERQIHLVLAKPVHRWQIWLGKWLALLALDAALLLVAGLAVYGGLRWRTRAGQLATDQRARLNDEILIARRECLPEPVNVDEPARRFLAERQAKGDVPAGAPLDQVYEGIRQMMLSQAYTVPTGYKRQWVFKLSGRPPGDRPLLFRFKFESGQIKDALVDGVWLVSPSAAATPWDYGERSAAGGLHTFMAPAELVAPDGTLVVEYANINPVPMAVLFSATDGLRLYTYAGGFEANLARSLAVVFCQLGFLAALSVTAGTLLSLPVAALITGYLLLLVHVGGYVESLATSAGTFFASLPNQPSPVKDTADAVLRGVLRLEGWVVQPLQDPNPFDRLAAGQLVDWGWVGAAFAIKLVLYAGVLGLLASWLFNRREVGLPS